MLKTTLTNLRVRKLRTFMTSLAVLLGVAFMSGTMVLSETMGRSFDELFETIFEDVDAVVRGAEVFETDAAFALATRPRLDEELVEAVAAVEGVVIAEPSIEGYAQIVGSDGKAVGNPGMGAPTYGMVWTETEELNPMVIVAGRSPESDREVVIDKKSADDGKLEVGDTTSILTAQGPVQVEIVGVATWGDADSPLGASVTGFTIEAAQELLGEPGKVDAISVVGDGTASQSELRDRVAAVVPAGAEVLTGEEIVEEQQSMVRQALSFFDTFMLTFALIALFVGSFIIYNTFGILVAQRNREMALMRALGASRRQVLGSVLLEAAVVGLIASVLGMLAGVVVAGLLKGILAAVGLEVPASGVAVTRGTVIAAFVTGLAVTVGAAFFPARKASRIPPVAAMSDVAFATVFHKKRRLAMGLAVVVVGMAMLMAGLLGNGPSPLGQVGFGAAVVFIGVAMLGPLIAVPVAKLLGAPLARSRGIVGTLARENAARNPKRSASTASALMIGVGLVGFITIFAASAKASLDEVIDRSFRGDFVVDSGTFGFGGFSPELRAELSDLDGVAAASPVRLTFAEIDEATTFLIAVDPTTVDQVFDVGVVAGSLDGLGEGAIAVWDEKAADEGWALGDTIDVTFVETGVQPLEIGLIFSNRDLVGSDYSIGVETFDANVAVGLDNSIYLAAEPGADPAEVKAAIEEVAAAYPTAKVLDNNEYKEAQAASFNQILALVYVMLALAVLIALLGIANTLALSVLERTRELGLLRAVGMTRSQLRSAVRWEAVIIAILGTMLGLVIGVFFGWALSTALEDQGFTAFVVPFGQLAVIVVIAAIAGVLAAIAPARRAARLDVLQALVAQ